MTEGAQPPEPADAADGLARLADGDVDARSIGRVARALSLSARLAGARAVTSGRWLATTFIDLAPRIKVRDAATLTAHYDGLAGAALADALIRNASRASGAVGAASGAVMSAEHFVPPAWVTMPFELVVETLAVAAIELKLVAELHEVYGRPVTGTPADRASALVRAWAERRGVSPATLTRPGGLADALGRGTRHELVRVVRRRLLARLGRNMSSLAPLFAGAVAGGMVNRSATRALGEAVVRDLAAASPGSIAVGSV
ncbi:MAG TPA: hypothetical protein VF230_18445 [Acidimicrobiales bacterium]